MIGFSRPPDQISGLDAPESVGELDTLDECREQDVLALAVLGFFEHEIAVARLR